MPRTHSSPKRQPDSAPDSGIAVSIVMPCLNEIESLEHCIANAQEALRLIAGQYGLAGEVVIADNGSSDGSQALAARLGARVVSVERPGYGAAIAGGFEQARGRYLIMGDADGSYDFVESVPMIGRLIDGAQLCMGSRFKGGIKPGAMPWKNRYIGNPVLTGILNLFFGSGVDDAHCGLRAIHKDAFQSLGLTGEGMEFASEMVIKASLRNFRMAEVPVSLSPDLRQRAPHLRPWRDGWRHLRYLFMLSPTWAFGVPAAFLMSLGALILAMSGLYQLGFAPWARAFGNSWAIIAGFMVSTGHISVIMALATHLYGVRLGYRTLNRRLAGLARFLTLEHALVLGGLLMLVSALALVVIGVWWRELGFAALPTTVPLVAAVTLGAVGLQTAFGGFLLAVIGGNDARIVS